MITCANPLAQYSEQKEEILEAIKRVLDNGNYILGPEVDLFEKEFSSFLNVKYSVGLNSGTDAIILALKALGIGRGDEVITVSQTALATISAIIAVGAVPVLVDIDPDYYTIDPDNIRKAITSRTKAIIAVHLYGQSVDLNSILKIKSEYNLFLIEDCAQATGATYQDHMLGSLGDLGCFSFYPTKNLGAIGDGGMVVTNNPDYYQRIVKLRQYGWDEHRKTVEPGINSRLDEIQASILRIKLRKLNQDNLKRLEIAKLYNTELAKLPIVLPRARPGSNHVYHLYVIKSEKRYELKQFLQTKNILAGIHYIAAGHQHGGYSEICKFNEADLSVTCNLTSQALSLPMYPELSHMEVREVCDSIKIFFKL